MINNNPEEIRKKLYEEYEDSLFKLVMYDVAEKEGQLFLIEKGKLKDDPAFLPSKEAVQKFSQLLDARLKKPRDYLRRQRILKALNRVAVVILIMFVILCTTVITVQAVRVRVLNYIIDIQQEYTSFEIKNNDNSLEGGSAVVDWRNAYVPTYIPDGYKVDDSSNSEFLRRIEFKNPQGSVITYMELSQSNKPALDTENASTFEIVSINGHEGTVVVKNSLVTIIWAMNDRMFIIRSHTEKNSAVRMAEGVKYIE